MNERDERALLLRSEAGKWRKEGVIDDAMRASIDSRYAVDGRVNGVTVQAVFLVLTTIALIAAYGLGTLFRIPLHGLIVGGAAIALAEYLLSIGWKLTGVEAALWLGGLFSIITALPSSNWPDALLVFAAAAAGAAWRLRHPLFGAVAAIVLMSWAEIRFDLGVISALVIGTGAMLLLQRTWRRASTEWLLIALTLLMPLAGVVTADMKWRYVTMSLYAAFGIIALVLAIIRRHHAFFLASIIGLAVSGTYAARELAAPPALKFFIAGALLLAIAALVSRALRDRTRGLVVTPETLTPYDEELQILATLSAQSASPRPEESQPAGGGAFGGAGASGDFSATPHD